MPYLNGFDASIVVNDVEVPHYAVEIDEESRTLTCWIPSVPGGKFAVTWKCLKGLMNTRGDVYIDGFGLGGEVIRRHQSHKDGKGKFSIVEKGKATISEFESFSFSDPQVEGLDLPPSTPHLGDIRIVIHRIDPLINLVHKRKGGENKGPKEIKSDEIERIAVFIFKYRTLEFLEAQSISSREATYRPMFPPSSETAGEIKIDSESMVAGSSRERIDLPNYKELFSVSADRATNKRKYEEIMVHNDDRLDQEICHVQARLNELRATKNTMRRIKDDGEGSRRNRKPAFFYKLLTDAAESVQN